MAVLSSSNNILLQWHILVLVDVLASEPNTRNKITHDASSIDGFLQKLQENLLDALKNEPQEAFMDCARNGVLEELEESNEHFEMLIHFECFCCEECDEDEDHFTKVAATSD